MAKRRNTGKTTVIGTALWVLAGDDDSLKKKILQAEKYINKAYSNISSAVTSFAKTAAVGMAAAGTALVGFVTAATKSFADYGSGIHDASVATGFSAETLSVLQYAMKQAGIEFSAITPAVKQMASVIADASNGSATAGATIERLGLSLGKLSGASPESAFLQIATAIGNVGDELTQTALATDIFGRGGMQILALVRDMQASGGFDALAEEARNLGLVMSDEAAAGADDLGDALQEVFDGMQGISNTIGTIFGPVFKEALKWVKEKLIEFREWLDTNEPSLTRIKNSLEAIGLELKEALGPAWTALKEFASQALIWISDKLEWLTQGAIKTNLDGTKEWETNLGKIIKQVKGHWQKFIESFKPWSKVIAAFVVTLGTIGTALALLESPLILISAAFTPLFEMFFKKNWTTNWLSRLVDKLPPYRKTIDWFFDAIVLAINKSRKAFEDFKRVWDAFWKSRATENWSAPVMNFRGVGLPPSEELSVVRSSGSSPAPAGNSFGNVNVTINGSGLSPQQLQRSVIGAIERLGRTGKMTRGGLAVPGTA